MRDWFKYYLFDGKTQKPKYIDGNGNMQDGDAITYEKANGDQAYLNDEPENWQETSVKYARNNLYWGLFRDMVTAMKFVGDGRLILKNMMWSFGVECVMFLGISKLDPYLLPYKMKNWHFTEINYAKYKETETAVEVEALEGGLNKYLKAREDTVYTITVDDGFIVFDGMDFDNQANFYPSNGNVLENNRQHTLDILLIGNEQQGSVNATSVSRMQFTTNDDLLNNPVQVLTTGSVATTVKIEFKIGVTVSLAEGFTPNPLAHSKIIARYIQPDGTPGSFDVIDYGNGGTLYQHHTLEGTVSGTVPANSKLYLINVLMIGGSVAIGSSADGVVFWQYDNSETDFLRISYAFRYKTTNVAFDWPLTVLKRVVEKMSEGKYTAHSDWLEAKKDIALTAGNNLRAIPGAVIQTSLKQFFRSFNAQFCVGLSVKDNILVFEPKEYFHKDEVIADLGEVADAEIGVAQDLICSNLKAGYPKIDYLDVNGKFEVNQGQNWSLPQTKVIQDLDLRSDYRADPTGMELLRINLEAKRTTDGEGDNDTFMAHVKDESTQINTNAGFLFFDDLFVQFNAIILFGEAARLAEFGEGVIFKVTGSANNDNSYTVGATTTVGSDLWIYLAPTGTNLVTEASVPVTISKNKVSLRRDVIPTAGVPYPESIFNVELSPRHGIIRNGKYIRPLLDFLDAEKIKLTSYDKNVTLESDMKESEDIAVGSLDEPLFAPYYFNFRTEVNMNLLDTLNTNPYGKIKFTWNKQAWYGWLNDGSVKPGINDSQDWKLLALPNQKLYKFNN